MPSTTITISTEARQRLQQFKRKGGSFTEVILRYLRPPADTCGELLDRIWEEEAPNVDEKRMAGVLKGRGRRSNRP